MSERRRRALRLILGWLALEAMAAAQVVHHDGSSLLRVWLGHAVAPLVWTASFTATAVSDLAVGVGGLHRMMVGHRHLRQELERTRAANILLRNDLAALMEGQAALSSVVLLEEGSQLARCTYRNLAQGRLQLHAPAAGLLRVDTAVVAGDGLVGRVSSVAADDCWVQLVSHPASAVAVESDDGTVRGLATGSGGGRLMVEFVPRGATLLRGELLVSSGADGVVPPGIPVARVAAVRETDAAFLEVMATPCVDLHAVHTVLLLPPWTRSREPTP